MADAITAIRLTIQNEGGYVNDPADPGGETNFGISKRSHPNVDIKALTVDSAALIYLNEYWNPLYTQINDQAVANKLFDMTVNMGKMGGVTILQRCLHSSAGWACPVDGLFGTGTLSFVNQTEPNALLNELRAQAAMYYVQIVQSSPSQQKFLLGWLRRSCK